MNSAVVSNEWLSQNLKDDNVVVVDGSWYLPDMKRDAWKEFLDAHIPGAIRIDIDTLSDTTSDLPHMLPDAATFSTQIGDLGINNESHVIVYDGAGLFSAARIWWMFRVMGHEKVSVLDGGLIHWKNGGFPVESGKPKQRASAPYKAFLQKERVVNADEVAATLPGQSCVVIDARGAPRFLAEEPEPRAGVRGGHIPNSTNVPYRTVLNADGTLKAPDALAAVFRDANVDLNKPVITSCGSGVTAAILVLCLELIGKLDVRLYDGSWSEWGAREDLTIAP